MKFKKALTKKYGDASIDSEDWDNDRHKKYYADDKASALSFGYLSYTTIWYKEDIKIMMSMSADNYEVSFYVSYFNPTAPLEEPNYSDNI